MLQRKTLRETETSVFQEDGSAFNFWQFIEPSYYIDVLERRALAFAGPFVLVLALGTLAIAARPVIYLIEGKLLVEAPQMPSELVRPTVTTLANERIQLIEQRVMTRDNLVAVADKADVFGPGRERPSDANIAAYMRTRVKVSATELPSRSYERQMMAFTVGFEHEQPTVALRVANVLITTILNEDIKARTDSASETTRFLERETLKLESELGAIELPIAELKRRNVDRTTPRPPSVEDQQLEALKAELAQKASIYSASHPDLKALKQRVAALESKIVPTDANVNAPEPGIDALERQQASLQKIVEAANQKLAAARLGESLEKGQRFERLEVIEQPELPNAPERPNRPKLFTAAFGVAFAAGVGFVLLLESRDDTIRRLSHLLSVAEPQLVVGIPSIETKAEAARRKRRTRLLIGLLVAAVLAGSAAAALLLPIDKLLAGALAAMQAS